MAFLGGCQSGKDRFNDLVGCLESISDSSGGPALAHVGDVTVTASEFLRYFNSIPPVYRSENSSLEARRQIMDSLIDQKIMVLTAHRLGLDRDENYQQQLAEAKVSLLRQPILASLGKISDNEILQYYNHHKAQYGPQSQVIASRILMKTLADAKKAQALLKSGRSFSAIAKAISIDPDTASQGGRMTPLIMRNLDPALAKALFALHKGEVSGLLKVASGYVLLRKDDVISRPASTLESAKPQIQSALEFQRVSQWSKKARKAIRVSIDENALGALAL